MTEQLPLNTGPLPVKLRVEDYLLLDEAGAFEAYNKTELIEGEILFVNAQHRPHGRTKTEFAFRLRDALLAIGSDLAILIETAVALPPNSVPEPDILLTREPEGSGLVPLASVALIVEVADATLANDLKRKAAIYAGADVPEYWVIDVDRALLIQLWQPEGNSYVGRREQALAESIVAATIAGLELPAAS